MFGRVKSEYLVEGDRIYDRTFDRSGYISHETVRNRENHMRLEESELFKSRKSRQLFSRPEYIFTDVYEDGRKAAEYNYDLHGGKGKTLYEVNYLRPDADGYIGYDRYNNITGALRRTYRQNQEGSISIEYDESSGEIVGEMISTFDEEGYASERKTYSGTEGEKTLQYVDVALHLDRAELTGTEELLAGRQIYWTALRFDAQGDVTEGEIFLEELWEWKTLKDTVSSVLALESQLFDTTHYYLQEKKSYRFDGTYFEVTRDTDGRIEKVHCTATK